MCDLLYLWYLLQWSGTEPAISLRHACRLTCYLDSSFETKSLKVVELGGENSFRVSFVMYFCIVDILPSKLTLQDINLTERKINLSVHKACQIRGLWATSLTCLMYTLLQR